MKRYFYVVSVLTYLTHFVQTSALPNLEDCTFVDLSWPFDANTIYWPGAKSFKLIDPNGGPQRTPFFYTAYNLEAAEHGGTHLDSPIHFAEGKRTTDQIPLRNLIGEACVVDVSAKASQNIDYQLSIDDITNFERQHGGTIDNCVLLMRTDWALRWPNRTAYLGSDDGTAKNLHFPGVHPDTAQWLVDNRAIKAFGLDTASMDYGQSKLFKTHQIFGARNIPGIENLSNLDRLPPRGATFVGAVMKIKNGSGGPIRAFAFGHQGDADPCRRTATSAASAPIPRTQWCTIFGAILALILVIVR